jgi:sialic acid synthase SpsE
MKIGGLDISERVFVIAEIGNNHEGDYGRAVEMVHAAAVAGADAVKFQTIVPERLVSATQTERIAQLGRFRFSHDQFAGLAEIARGVGIEFLSTPFDVESAVFLEALVPAFKIASSDNTFRPLLEFVASTGKPVLLSSGLCDADELRETLTYMESCWNGAPARERLVVLHCVSAYPTPPEQAGLAAIRGIADLGVTPGYSDHTLGIEAAVLSVACGARVVEKHFTLDKNLSGFRDHQLSADPAELRTMVERIRMAEQMLGTEEIVCSTCEAGNKVPLRRSIVAAADLAAGTVLGREHLDWTRPGGGLAPGMEHVLVGSRLNRSLRRGEMVLPDHLISG